MIILKLMLAIIFLVSVLLIFDTRIIVRKFFTNMDRNKTVQMLRWLGYIGTLISAPFLAWMLTK